MTARRGVLLLFLLGLDLLVIGAAVFFWQFPHPPDDGWVGYSDDGGSALRGFSWELGWPGTEGDLRLALAGAAVAGAGFLVVLVPIIAWGVHLGRSLGRPAAE